MNKPSREFDADEAELNQGVATVVGTATFHLKSESGADYKISVAPALPANSALSFVNEKRPDVLPYILYVLDANVGFATTVELVRMLQLSAELPPVTVVGIGYSSDDLVNWYCARLYDMTPSENRPSYFFPPEWQSGGSDAFCNFISATVKPFIERTYAGQHRNSIMAGFSFGGLCTMSLLLQKPEGFSNFLALGPSLWFDDYLVLKRFQQYLEKGEGKPVNLFVSAGGLETLGDGGEAADPFQMIGNIRRLDDMLKLNPGVLNRYSNVILEGETHATAYASSLARGLKFLLTP